MCPGVNCDETTSAQVLSQKEVLSLFTLGLIMLLHVLCGTFVF